MMKRSFKFTLLALAVTSTLAPMLAAPAVKLLLLDFKDTNPLLIQLVVTFASFFILPSLLIGSFLSKRISKKAILCIGLILYVIGGVGPAFMDSIAGILVLRAVLGFGIGFITPLMNAFVAEYFEDDERSKMNGLTVGVNGLGGAFFLTIGGAITVLGWRGVFWTYSFGVVLLVLVLLFVPHEKPILTAKTVSRTKTTPIPIRVYKIGLITTALMIMYYVIPSNLASFVVDNGLGSSATSGYLTALSFIFVFLAGITGTRLNKLLKKGIVPFILFLLGLAFLLMSQAFTLWMVAFGVALVGFGFGLAYPILLNKMAIATPIAQMTLAVMLMTGFANIGQFISPLITNLIQSLFHLDSIRSVFFIIMILIVLIFLAAVTQSFTSNKKKILGN
ncbi:MFS transporter [Paenibacillus psychroresistens]|uniref:MFS transporter n=1 Tax=Paenibacillus psychroresistens TaxID=1778678 RepID=A0A6B8RQX3_9BACL|nr:MFS transporter [Paenibacillus psychroresistens]QGQ97678.1 MFS transporter [Paenibacillus psychroresistens]